MKNYLPLAIAISISVVSCSPFQVKSDYDQTANFPSYKSYFLDTSHLQMNDIDKARVNNALSSGLAQKGLSANNTDPDLIVDVRASHKTVKDVTYISPWSSWGGYGWGGRFGMGWRMAPMGFNQAIYDTYNNGALQLDIIDARTHKLVWQASGNGLDVDNPKSKARQIPKIIADILKEYPAQLPSK